MAPRTGPRPASSATTQVLLRKRVGSSRSGLAGGECVGGVAIAGAVLCVKEQVATAEGAVASLVAVAGGSTPPRPPLTYPYHPPTHLSPRCTAPCTMPRATGRSARRACRASSWRPPAAHPAAAAPPRPWGWPPVRAWLPGLPPSRVSRSFARVLTLWALPATHPATGSTSLAPPPPHDGSHDGGGAAGHGMPFKACAGGGQHVCSQNHSTSELY